MKKFLVGLPYILFGLLLIVLPGVLFGEIGLIVEEIIVLVGALIFFSYVKGEEILEKRKNRK